MSIRLLALDYDGTAALDGRLPSARVIEALAAAAARGIRVVLATGRPYASAARYAKALGLCEPVICYQGAMVRELAGDRLTLMVEPMPPEPMAELLSLAEDRRLDLNLYGEDEMYLISQAQPADFYERWFGLPARQVSRFADACDILAARGQRPLKGLFIGEPEQSDRTYQEMVERFDGRLSVVRSHPLFVEACSLQASKGNALALLARRFGVPQADCMAVGDSGNDVSMLRWAGFGVAMGNAAPDVVASADWVAPSVHEDGLAAAVEKHILSNGHRE